MSQTDQNQAMRVSQAERERVVDALRDHAGEGRLEVHELEERVEAALGARTRADLQPLLSDLPRPRQRRARVPLTRAVGLGSFATAVLPLLAAVAIIAWAPAGLVWVGWTALFWWFFAALPSAGLGLAWCGYSNARCRRRSRAVAA